MPVIVLHSTEGSTLQGAVNTLRTNNSMSHEVWDIDYRQRVQLVPLDRPARTLVNLPGGVETNNRGGVIQVEIVGWASRYSRDQAGATAGPIMDELDDDQLRWLGAQVRDLCAQTGTPFEFPLPFLPYPRSYGANGVRMNGAQWLSVHGVVGHQHAPENAHGDPGALDVARMAALTAPVPSPAPSVPSPSEEDDMSLTIHRPHLRPGTTDVVDFPWLPEEGRLWGVRRCSSTLVVAMATEAGNSMVTLNFDAGSPVSHQLAWGKPLVIGVPVAGMVSVSGENLVAHAREAWV